MGWTETRIDYDEEPDGKAAIERVDPMQMYWDAGATKKNLSDARRLFRVKDVPHDEARALFPEADDAALDAAWAGDPAATAATPHDAEQAPYYRADQAGRVEAGASVRLVECQWWELEPFWRVVDPFTGSETALSQADYDTLAGRLALLGLAPPAAIRQRRRRYRRAVLGAGLLKLWDGPDKGGFTWKCITADRDRNRGTWYGFVKAMLDPQRWANKWLSQTLHILNTGAKGGVIAELDAFDDPDEAEENWADPAAIVWAEKGGVTGGKIMPRPQTPMPPAMNELLTLAISSIRDVAGVNLELLGMVEQDQPGIVEKLRKQAGMTVLAGIFANLRRYRKEQGRLLLWFITTFLSDGRLIRIVGPEQARYVPLIHQPMALAYDVVVDDTPTSPNLKEQVWSTLVEMMPFLSKLPVPPAVYLELLKYSPMPTTVTSRIAEIVQGQQAQQPPPDPNLMVAQSTAALNQAEADRARVRAASDAMRSRTDAALAMADLEKRRADTELARADAAATLAKAGLVPHDARAEAVLMLLQLLDRGAVPASAASGDLR